MTDTPMAEDPMVAALLRERAGYVGRKGKEDRVTAVDEQLSLRGYSPDGTPLAGDTAEEQGEETTEEQTAAAAAEEETRAAPPRRRRARSTEQA